MRERNSKALPPPRVATTWELDLPTTLVAGDYMRRLLTKHFARYSFCFFFLIITTSKYLRQRTCTRYDVIYKANFKAMIRMFKVRDFADT